MTFGRKLWRYLAVTLMFLLSSAILVMNHSTVLAEGALCEIGSVRTRNSNVAEAYVGAFSTEVDRDSSIYQPDEGWYIEDFRVSVISRWGDATVNTDYLQAESRVATTSQLNQSFDDAIDAAVKFGDKSAEARLHQARESHLQWARTAESSHRALIVRVRASGNGRLSDRTSNIKVRLVVTERCVGSPSVNTLTTQLIERYVSGHSFYVRNNCHAPIDLWLSYKTLSGNWDTEGRWHFDGNEGNYLASTSDLLLRSDNGIFYYYAESTDGSNYVWSGENYREFANKTLPMRKLRLSLDSDGDWPLYISCDS